MWLPCWQADMKPEQVWHEVDHALMGTGASSHPNTQAPHLPQDTPLMLPERQAVTCWLLLLNLLLNIVVCSTLNPWAVQWRQEMSTNLASLSDLNKSQRDSVARAVMQTCSLWQVSLCPNDVR